MKNEINKIKVSIITVSFNSVKTIEETICSVINQTYPNIEYIIIDGGSTDGTVDIIKKYEKNISYWVSEPDNGIYDAMNKGILKSTGNIIGIINSDDWYDLGTIQNIVEQFHESNYDIIHGDLIVTYENGEIHRKWSLRSKPSRIFPGMFLHHPTCFIKKSIYHKYGLFNSKFYIAADYELLLRFYIKGAKFIYLKKDVVYFRMGGVSSKKIILGVNEVRDIAIQYGYSRFLSYCWYVYKIYLYKLRIFMSNNGLSCIVDFYRKFIKI